ncbi:DUF4126 domain-containing protein, partial [Xanthomonas perforans]
NWLAPRPEHPSAAPPLSLPLAPPGLAGVVAVVSRVRGGVVVWGFGRLRGGGMRRLVAPMRPAATPTARSSPLP